MSTEHAAKSVAPILECQSSDQLCRQFIHQSRIQLGNQIWCRFWYPLVSYCGDRLGFQLRDQLNTCAMENLT